MKIRHCLSLATLFFVYLTLHISSCVSFQSELETPLDSSIVSTIDSGVAIDDSQEGLFLKVWDEKREGHFFGNTFYSIRLHTLSDEFTNANSVTVYKYRLDGKEIKHDVHPVMTDFIPAISVDSNGYFLQGMEYDRNLDRYNVSLYRYDNAGDEQWHTNTISEDGHGYHLFTPEKIIRLFPNRFDILTREGGVVASKKPLPIDSTLSTRGIYGDSEGFIAVSYTAANSILYKCSYEGELLWKIKSTSLWLYSNPIKLSHDNILCYGTLDSNLYICSLNPLSGQITQLHTSGSMSQGMISAHSYTSGQTLLLGATNNGSAYLLSTNLNGNRDIAVGSVSEEHETFDVIQAINHFENKTIFACNYSNVHTEGAVLFNINEDGNSLLDTFDMENYKPTDRSGLSFLSVREFIDKRDNERLLLKK